MTQKRAWIWIAEMFENEKEDEPNNKYGICRSIKELTDKQYINTDLSLIMYRRVKAQTYTHGLHIWPTRSHYAYKPEHSALRAALCRKFAEECDA